MQVNPGETFTIRTEDGHIQCIQGKDCLSIYARNVYCETVAIYISNCLVQYTQAFGPHSPKFYDLVFLEAQTFP